MKGTAISQFWLTGAKRTLHAQWARKDAQLGMDALDGIEAEHWMTLSDQTQRELVRRAYQADLNH